MFAGDEKPWSDSAGLYAGSREGVKHTPFLDKLLQNHAVFFTPVSKRTPFLGTLLQNHAVLFFTPNYLYTPNFGP